MQYSKLLMFVSAVALILLASVPNAATQAAPVPEPMPYSCIDGGIICDPKPVPIYWQSPLNADCVRGFSSIGGARTVHNGSPASDRDEIPNWNVSDLLRGITPKSMFD
ncbi:hypothetical protein F5H01DRAFT_374577 [Linnemannia elongata]|nr:hypothetical protein F5H01DRAFT_374577 [Linnemannia elongata]